jgi:hypothetical protein
LTWSSLRSSFFSFFSFYSDLLEPSHPTRALVYAHQE